MSAYQKNIKEKLKNISLSRPEVFCKKGVLRNLTKFTGKHLRQNLFFNKVVGFRLLLNVMSHLLLKKRIVCQIK